MRRLLLALVVAASARAGPFVLSLVPGADLTASPGGPMTWSLEIENDDANLFLSIDAVNWTQNLDPGQGAADDFASFTFPLVAPSSTEVASLFSITWDPAATPGYATSEEFIVSASDCVDSDYTGCVSNDDTTLPFTAAVEENAVTDTPEPGTAALLAAALVFVARRSIGPGRL